MGLLPQTLYDLDNLLRVREVPRGIALPKADDSVLIDNDDRAETDTPLFVP
jgi:hypothetical protein